MTTSTSRHTGGPTRPDRTVEVVVVGGGPTGMTLAGDLARCGRSVAVLERWPSINPSSRAFATMARTLEVLDARGLAEDLLTNGATTGEIRLFHGATLDLSHLRSRYRFAMITPQTEVDRALGRYAEEQGADVHRGLEVVDLAQDAHGVTITARPKDDLDPEHVETWRAAYVVGADGAHSTVRDLLGLDFPGKSVLSSVVLADVRLTAGPAGRGLTLGSTADEFGFLVPYGRPDPAGGEWYRTMTWDRNHQVPDSEPVSEAEIVTVLGRAMGRDVGVAGIGWHSRFHCEERQVPRYRVGRVFLAGDAAHVHAPMGGQGMNTGIQDAANLAWKLDAVLAGAPDAVLDTYHRERHPIGKRILRQSGAMMRAVTLRPRPARWLRDHLAPKILPIPAVRDAVAGSFAGTELRYPAGKGGSGLVGSRATEVPLAEGRVTELLRRPGFLLVREHDALPVDGADVAQARRTDTGPALLIRPDGYIAWAGHLHGRDRREGWRDVLARWTGSSSRRRAPQLNPPPSDERSDMPVTVIQIGLDPDVIDFDSPDFARFPGLSKEKLRKANDDNVAALRAAGYDVDNCLVDFGEAGAATAAEHLSAKHYDAVLIGAGIRLVASNTLLFEQILNAAHRLHPNCRFVFNYDAESTPGDIRRWYPDPADPTPSR